MYQCTNVAVCNSGASVAVFVPTLYAHLKGVHEPVMYVSNADSNHWSSLDTSAPLSVGICWPAVTIYGRDYKLVFDAETNLITSRTSQSAAFSAASDATLPGAVIRIGEDEKTLVYTGHLEDQELVVRMQAEQWLQAACAWTAAGDHRLIVGSANTVIMMATCTPSIQRVLEFPAVALAASDTRFAVADDDARISVYSAVTFELTHEIECASAMSLAFVTGSRLAVGTDTNSVLFYNLDAREWTPDCAVVSSDTSLSTVTLLAASRDGRYLAASVGRNRVCIFSLADGCALTRVVKCE
jgi:hypothetical protein